MITYTKPKQEPKKNKKQKNKKKQPKAYLDQLPHDFVFFCFFVFLVYVR